MATTIPAFTPSEALYPFEGRWLDLPQGRLHYVDEGSGRPILMLHGNPTWSFLYRDLITALRDRFRCVAIDYLGYGLSERPPGFGYTPAEHAGVIGEVITRLDLRDLIVMGHDWGGPTGLSAAADHPDRITGLVLGNTWFWPAERTGRLFSRVMSTRLLQHQILDRNLFVERILFNNITRRLSEEEKDHYRAVQPNPAMRVAIGQAPRQITAARDWLATLQQRVTTHLATLPVLVTYPMADRAFPAKTTLPRLRSTFDDIQIVELPGIKHYFLEDATPTVADAITHRFGPP